SPPQSPSVETAAGTARSRDEATVAPRVVPRSADWAPTRGAPTVRAGGLCAFLAAVSTDGLKPPGPSHRLMGRPLGGRTLRLPRPAPQAAPAIALRSAETPGRERLVSLPMIHRQGIEMEVCPAEVDEERSCPRPPKRRGVRRTLCGHRCERAQAGITTPP